MRSSKGSYKQVACEFYLKLQPKRVGCLYVVHITLKGAEEEFRARSIEYNFNVALKSFYMLNIIISLYQCRLIYNGWKTCMK